MSTAPTCPQCGRPGVRTEKVAGEAGGEPKLLWICELDHRFG